MACALHVCTQVLLAAAGSSSHYPLEFGLSLDDLDSLSTAREDADAEELDSLSALRICAQLCVLRDDESGQSAEAQTTAALLELLRCGSLRALDGELNDDEASALVSCCASAQLAVLRAGGADLVPGAPPPRAECVLMASQLRRSEEAVLARLCEGDDVRRLFEGE